MSFFQGKRDFDKLFIMFLLNYETFREGWGYYTIDKDMKKRKLFKL